MSTVSPFTFCFFNYSYCQVIKRDPLNDRYFIGLDGLFGSSKIFGVEISGFW